MEPPFPGASPHTSLYKDDFLCCQWTPSDAWVFWMMLRSMLSSNFYLYILPFEGLGTKVTVQYYFGQLYLLLTQFPAILPLLWFFLPLELHWGFSPAWNGLLSSDWKWSPWMPHCHILSWTSHCRESIHRSCHTSVPLSVFLFAGIFGWADPQIRIKQDVFPPSPSHVHCFGAFHCTFPKLHVNLILGNDLDPLALCQLLHGAPVLGLILHWWQGIAPQGHHSPTLLLMLSTASSSLQLTSASSQEVRLLGSNLEPLK